MKAKTLAKLDARARDAKAMSYDRIHLARECRKCGVKFKQLVSFVEEKGRIMVKIYRYKCPFCDALTRKPMEEEIRECMRH